MLNASSQGSPPSWSPPNIVPELTEDFGEYFADPNAARFPSHPTEPSALALFIMQPSFDSSKVDVYGCSHTLDHLLAFVNDHWDSFVFDIELIGNTLFLVRREDPPDRTIDGVRGYGHSFAQAYTQWPTNVADSETHQRLARYNFGDLTCLVRYEGDGYFNDEADAMAEHISNEAARADEPAAFSSTTALMDPPEESAISQSGHHIKYAGHERGENAMFEVKTRAVYRPLNMEYVYPRLWMRQVKRFIAAYHDGHGEFEDIQIQNHGPQVREWEIKNQTSVRSLHAVLKLLKKAVKDSGYRKAMIRRLDRGPLEVRQHEDSSGSALPTYLRKRWTARSNLELWSSALLQ